MNNPTIVSTFFEDPAIYIEPPREFGVLYLLRRDIEYCMGTNPNEGHAIFPATMAILAGVDLLAKFLAGDDQGQVGTRFKDYLKECFSLDEDESKTIYQLRNSLLHSFGLISKTRSKTYRFRLVQNGSTLINEQNDITIVDVRVLKEKFDESIVKYKSLVESDNDYYDKFESMYGDYGAIFIG